MFSVRNFISLVVAFTFSSSISSAIAQTPDTATLTGHVQDSTHAAIAHAAVTVTNLLTGLQRTAQTSSQGKFSVTGLPGAGTYDVETVKDGFAPAQLRHIALAGGSTATVVVTLNISSANTVITTTGTATDVRTDEPQLGDRLSAPQIDAMPLLNRRITFLPLLNAANRPAINQGDIFMNQNLFTTNGAGRRQAWFEVDGANAIDSWGRQTIFTNIPAAAVEEMSILTSAFSAEYGGSTGSVVNIVTKSGGDRLHGDVLELYRPSGPEAKLSGFNSSNATSGNDITNDTLSQTAASLSGKLFKKDPTHFFFAGEFSQQNRASPVTSPLAPGNFIGHYQDLLGFLRLDRQMSKSNNAFFRLSADGFHDTNPNGIVGGAALPNVARTFHRRTYSGELGDTAVLTPKLVNNLRLQFQLASPITEFDPVVNGTQFVVPIAGAATFTSGTSQSALLMNRQYEVSETLSASLGKHQLIAGGNWIFAHTGGNSKEFGGPIYLGSFTYKTCSFTVAICESPAYLNNIANVATYQQSYGNASYTVNDNLFAIFAQDDYHATRKLTLNLGLRYEQQTFTDSHANFGPRIGFVYDPRGTGDTVVRGGFGIYYSQIVDNSQANYSLVGPTGVFNYTAAPGQVGFPSSIAEAPLPALPPNAVAPLRSLYIRPGNSAYLNQFFPTSALIGYPDKLLSPYSEQWTVSIEQRLTPATILNLDYIGTHTVNINRPLDVDAPTSFTRTAQNQMRTPQAANCTRPYWVAWYQQMGLKCNITTSTNRQPPYAVIQSDVNNGYVQYNALDANLRHNFGSKGLLLASYTWSHTIDNVDPDTTSQNPNDPLSTGAAEKGNAIYDQRNRFVLSGFYIAPFKIQFGGILTLAGGLPYNLVTGTTNSGDTGATTDRPVINGVVVGRNTGRGTPIYSFDPFLAREFPLFSERVRLNLRAEAFNALNHANFVGFTNTYGNNASAPASLGAPLAGITNQLPARQMQFSARLSF
jgi:hypothetical protein